MMPNLFLNNQEEHFTEVAFLAVQTLLPIFSESYSWPFVIPSYS
jgi:hypothetical protein